MNNIIYSCPKTKFVRNKEKIIVNNTEINISDFLKNYSRDKKYFVNVSGCQMNVRDSEFINGILSKIGFNPAKNIYDAEIVVFNTCAIRERAENKTFGKIGKLKNKNTIIIVTGCMIMQLKIIKKILKSFPYVNIILDSNNIFKLPTLLEEFLKSKKCIVDVNNNEIINEKLPEVRQYSFKAYVNVNYGCDNFCTYCIVPYVKGRERDREEETIINECKKLAKLNYKEIFLLGQNVDSYGKKLEIKTNFAKLLDKVASLNIPRVSFLTNHPNDFSLEIVDVMKKHNNIMPFIHLPLQSGDDRILKLMNRKYNSKQYLDLINNIRQKIPNIAITTDIIIGFPSETETAFNNTIKLIKKIKFDSVYLFIFSKRNGTLAAKFKKQINYKKKVQRFKKLALILKKIIEDNNKKYLGNIYDVLVDSVSKTNDEVLTGRLITNKTVNFKGEKKLIGSIVKIKIISSHIYYLFGELIK